MGIFWDDTAVSGAAEHLIASEIKLRAPDLDDDDVATKASALAAAAKGTAATTKFHANRMLVALAFVMAFVGAGIGTEAAGLNNSSKALFGLGSTAFGIIVGIVTGEKPK